VVAMDAAVHGVELFCFDRRERILIRHGQGSRLDACSLKCANGAEACNVYVA
jgi:hypothetical protein